MKLGLILSLTFLSVLSGVCIQNKLETTPPLCALSIKVDGKVTSIDNEPLIGAHISIKDNAITSHTDLDGSFSIYVPNRESILIVSYTGYQSKEVTLDKSFPLEIILEEIEVLDEVIITKEEQNKAKKYAAKPAVERKETKDAFSKTADKRSAYIAEETTLGMSMYDDVSAPMLVRAESEIAEYDLFTSSDMEVLPKSGQLTAGEWNDLNNWEDWKLLIKEYDYKDMESHWQIFPSERYPVFITNNDGLPVSNCIVELKDNYGNTVWKNISDNTGKAELWNGLDGQKSTNLKIVVSKDGYSSENIDPQTAANGINHFSLNTECKKYKDVEIMFVVDATGSMGDEISYLRSELSNVIKTVKENDKNNLNYRIGSVFYKDTEDDYLTETSDLNNDISKTINFIKTKSAGGGGDFPEAVDEALAAALDQKWTNEAAGKFIFLLLDAPPHHNDAVMARLQMQIKTAAAKGIKIIPITASGIDRPTEFLMKFLSISTNGTYVFITDDSGIGGSHLDPIVDDFEVEKLNELLIRVISHYTMQPDCQYSVVQNSELDFEYFPNPASNYVTVNLTNDADKIIVRSASGMIVLQESNLEKGDNEVRLDNFVPGMYFITVIKDDVVSETKSLIVVS